jgi:molybdopterin-guanine dinucleotide biosynthesis protein A
MIGIVLCGGLSTRMGSDKGLILKDNEAWAKLASKKLQSLGLPVKFSVNSNQELSYGHLFGEDNLIPDQQGLTIGGPLKGILSVHLVEPTVDLFVLACDLVRIENPLLEKLMTAKQNNQDFEAYAYANSHFYEPLCGIYTAKGLARIAKVYQEGNLMKFSLQSVLDQLRTYKIMLTDFELSLFKNFNSPNEI